MSAPAPVEHLELEITDGIATIRVVRPERRNAFTNRMYEGLANWLLALDRDDEVRCIVIRGSGGIFTSGSDISYFLDRPALEREHHFGLVADLLIAPSRIRKPVVAAVQGTALGGGTGLTAACDLAIAEEGAVFGLPEVDIGIWPCTLLPALIRAVGPRRAYELALLGERFDATRAQSLDLVHRVVAKDAFEAEVGRLAARIAGLSPVVVELGKRAFHQALDVEYTKATRFMGQVMALSSASEDAREGITAFLGKRSPLWAGR